MEHTLQRQPCASRSHTTRRGRTLAALLLAGLLGWAGANEAGAATMPVAPGAVAVSAGDGICSLPEAILNATTDSDTSGGDCPAGSGADEIVLATGSVYTLHQGLYVPGEGTSWPKGATALPPLVGPLVIRGNGAVIERAVDASDFRLLYVASETNAAKAVTLENLTLRQGRTYGFRGADYGGGVYNEGVLVLIGVTLSGNEAAAGGGLYNSGNAQISSSMVSDNTAGGSDATDAYGGGILNDGVMTLETSTVERNTGGGLASGGALTVLNSTIRENAGSGLEAFDTTTRVVNSIIRDNTSHGIRNHDNNNCDYFPSEDCGLVVEYSTIADNGGSGIFNTGNGRARIVSTTITGHGTEPGSVFSSTPTDVFTLDDGRTEITGSFIGGVRSEHVGQSYLRNSTVANVIVYRGHAGLISTTVTGIIENATYYGEGGVGLRNTIVVGTCSSFEVGEADNEPNNAIGSQGYNLVGAGSGCPSNGPGDLTVDPATFFSAVLFATAADNDGLTPTHALLAGSPALDAAACTDAQGQIITEDQRGLPRPAGIGCDIGAFELQVATPPPDTSPPVCGAIILEQNTNGKLTAVSSSARDPESGIATVRFTTLRNMQGFLNGLGPFAKNHTETFDPAQTPEVAIRGERLDMSSGGAIVVRVTNGAGLSRQCDPVIETVSAEVPEAFALGANYPNPFNPETVIPFALPERVAVSLAVYDVLGREVARLVDGELAPGSYMAMWDGRDRLGTPVAGGVYLYRLRAGTFISEKTMVLLK